MVQMAMTFSVAMYLVLVGLNCMWYKKMVAGAFKHLSKKTDADTTKGKKEK